MCGVFAENNFIRNGDGKLPPVFIGGFNKYAYLCWANKAPREVRFYKFVAILLLANNTQKDKQTVNQS